MADLRIRRLSEWARLLELFLLFLGLCGAALAMYWVILLLA